jgi:L-alanine-DL-glutamate epimerase-like enolase superfamily enzyme
MHTFAGLMNGVGLWSGHGSGWPDAFRNPPEPKDGILMIPDPPGLGLTLNRDALRKSEVAE